MSKLPFGPMSIANGVWKASISPVAAGLVACSFVMVAFGSTLYITSVPGMIVNDNQYVEPIVSTSASNAEGSDAASEDDASSNLLDDTLFGDIVSLTSEYTDGDNSFGLGAVSIMKSGLSVPVLDFSLPGGGSSDDEGGDSSSDELIPPQGDGSPSTPTDPSIPTTPSEPEKPPELTEEEKQELMYQSVLAGAYNELPTLYEQVADSFITFYANHDNPDATVRRGYYTASTNLYNTVNAAYNKHMYVEGKGTIKIPTTSKWYAKSVEIKALYDDLKKAQANVRTAWQQNALLGKPYETYIKPIQDNSINGQSKYLLDFVERYPGAIPQ